LYKTTDGMFQSKPDKESFRISMIYNNIGDYKNLKNAWGLSIWIETINNNILFDTGGDANVLLDNISNLNLDIQKLSKIILSHNHWDHTNALDDILENHAGSPEIFVVKNDLEEFLKKYPAAKIKGVNSFQQIDKDIWTTGELIGTNGNTLCEQGLLLVHERNLVLLTGCSHSGIVDMVKRTKQIFPDKSLELVAGGFHLGTKSIKEIAVISKDLKALKVKNIAPSHCTGDNAINYFRNDWQDNFIDLNLGEEYYF